MPRDTSNRLVDYARDRVGDALRTVAVLYDDGCEVVYLRDGLESEYSSEQYEAVAASFRTEMGVDDHVTGESPVGEKVALIHQHEAAFVFQFPHPDCHSILLSVEPEVGSQLQSFITECQRRF